MSRCSGSSCFDKLVWHNQWNYLMTGPQITSGTTEGVCSFLLLPLLPFCRHGESELKLSFRVSDISMYLQPGSISCSQWAVLLLVQQVRYSSMLFQTLGHSIAPTALSPGVMKVMLWINEQANRQRSELIICRAFASVSGDTSYI